MPEIYPTIVFTKALVPNKLIEKISFSSPPVKPISIAPSVLDKKDKQITTINIKFGFMALFVITLDTNNSTMIVIIIIPAFAQIFTF